MLIAVFFTAGIFYSTIILASYTSLEEQYIRQDLDQAVNKYQDEIGSLSLTASDWGPWDETVYFVNGNAPDYISSNLHSFGYENLDLNLIVITNTRGEILYSGAYDIQKHSMVPVPSFFSGTLDPRNPLMNMSDPHYVTTGILMLPEDPMLVVSQPIVYSNFSGRPQGVVIMGRYISQVETSRLTKLTRLTLTFKRIEDRSVSPDIISRLRQYSGTSPGIIIPLNNDEVAGYSLIRDIYGNDALILEITEPRDIYHQGITTTLQFILLILAACLVLGLGIIFLMDHAVLGRIRSLADQVSTIGRSGKSRDPVKIDGDDELTGLALEINRMLGTIRETHDGLMQSEARFHELADLLPQIIYEADNQGNLKYTNRIAFANFGYTEEEFQQGLTIQQMIVPEDRERASALFRIMSEGKDRSQNGKIPNEFLAVRKDGSTFPVSIYSSPVVENGTITGLRGILVDITERKKAEDALRVANRQLSLLTGITRHDINNQMTVVRGYTSLLEMTQKDTISAEYFRKINASLDRISAMIQFTKEYESIGSQAPLWQDCHALVESSRFLVSPGTIAIKNDIPAGSEVFADPLIAKVFYNLVDNAIRHGGTITSIRFGVQESGDSLLILCEDNGIGIPANEKKRIFERGFGKNTGLGLFLAQEILSITGITIRETGEPGKGARFEMVVPWENWRKPEL
ncbi:MAG: PAS domain S-box protein [Methanoregula sp.]|nr:CHASE4 domain-containing protein [Methanoregula sp.]MDD1686014.1 PAS domain S-box protein [Methanoregula sp.]